MMMKKEITVFQKEMKKGDFIVISAIRNRKSDYFSGRVVEMKSTFFKLSTADGVKKFDFSKVEFMQKGGEF